jgi:hypothetical protein
LPGWVGPAEAVKWISDNQYRYPFKDGTKGEHYRTIGIPQKLSPDGKQWQLWFKLMKRRSDENGYTTICFTTHPLDPNQMLNIFENFQHYDRITLEKNSRALQAKWDEYDLADDRECMKLILNSLDPALRRSIELDMETGLTAVLLIYLTFGKTQIRNPSYFTNLGIQLTALRILNYRDQNVTAMVLDMKLMIEELEGANRFNWEFLPKLLHNLQEAGDNERQ